MLYADLGGNINIKDIEKELKEKYTSKSKTGRRKKKEQCSLLLSAYNLIHRTSLKTDKVVLNDQEALFLLEFFNYLGLDKQKKENGYCLYACPPVTLTKQKKAQINWWYFE